MMLNRICDLAFSLSKNYQKKKSGKKKKTAFLSRLLCYTVGIRNRMLPMHKEALRALLFFLPKLKQVIESTHLKVV